MEKSHYRGSDSLSYEVHSIFIFHPTLDQSQGHQHRSAEEHTQKDSNAKPYIWATFFQSCTSQTSTQLKINESSQVDICLS